jgi:hypothetical protein
MTREGHRSSHLVALANPSIGWCSSPRANEMRGSEEPVGWRSFEWSVTAASHLRWPASCLRGADVLLSASHFDNS